LRGLDASGQGRRIRRAPFHSITRRGPDSERIRAFLFSPSRLAADSPSRPTGMHRLRVGAGGSLFNKLPRTRLHNWVQCEFAPSGYSSAGRARPRHGRGPGFDARYPLQASHCGCVPAQRSGMRSSTCRDGRNVRRRDACARAARAHHSGAPRSRWSTTAMRSKAHVAQQEEQPPCKRQAAGSIPVTSTMSFTTLR
jgi:hypothetical protein